MQLKRKIPDAIQQPLSQTLLDRLKACRQHSLTLAKPLSDEDQVVQAMDDASPTKWHLAHTTWFFESFVLKDHLPGYQTFSEDFEYCFNSYYESKGSRQPRGHRGLLTRPTGQQVRDYRDHVDHALKKLADHTPHDEKSAHTIARLIELGINHEQQHQELLLTDILALFASQPLRPAYRPASDLDTPTPSQPNALQWINFRAGVQPIGHSGPSFSYDNEGPRHHVLTQPFKLANRCVTNGEWLEFMKDGGYQNPILWLADGWKTVQENQWNAPKYWEQKNGSWHQMTLEGLVQVDPSTPVSHVSYYEADAFARWTGKRLPTEFEWEIAAQGIKPSFENTTDITTLRPSAATSTSDNHPSQMFGDVWQWTQSAYQPYPGYKPPQGALGEYNGKFMCSQQVLRGSSCVTPNGHSRTTYRNFFYPHQRWQFTGLRLAEDLS